MPGTETRQRAALLQIRVSDAELVAIRDAADRVGLTPASYARQVLLGPAPARSVRRPPLDRVEAARLLALLGGIGDDLRSLSRPGSDEAPDPAFQGRIGSALDQLGDMRDALMRALRREP